LLPAFAATSHEPESIGALSLAAREGLDNRKRHLKAASTATGAVDRRRRHDVRLIQQRACCRVNGLDSDNHFGRRIDSGFLLPS
jgi:hypothetical protein